MKPVNRRRLRFLAGFSAYFIALWLLWDTPIVYPLKVFVVLLHEISHAGVALATGGRVEAIILDPRQGGLCRCPGGNAFLTLSAGYLGSLAWGALILAGGRLRRDGPRLAAGAIGLIVLLITLAFVRNPFGILFGLLFGSGLVAAARRLSVGWNGLLLTGIGLTSCLYAVLDIKSDVLDRPDLASDARLLAELTGIPTLAWGLLWIAAALAVSGWLFVRGWTAASRGRAS